MDDLFSVFAAPTASGSGTSAAEAGPSNAKADSGAAPKPKRQKRVEPPTTEDGAGAPKPVKKAKAPRMDAPKPVTAPVVATDEFEQEQTREVADSGGLAGAAGHGPVTLSHQVRHQVAIPPNFPYTPINRHVMTEPPARVYPFTLDPFQATSIASIDRNESVLVSAHTSAGKTVVAEYAIAQCLRDKQRVIYTSPIKKYRDLLGEFGDVGLMTGDVTINPTASCLVMTTEILRSMLYRGSEIMREVAWVVFDEIHYMRDAERGVVWEETIILLPHKVHYVFLSATIPNALEFAEWICKTHEQPCHVVYTDFRPTPLQHYLFPANGDGIHLVVDEKSVFREDNFQKAMGSLSDSRGEDPADSKGGKGRKGKTKKGGQKGPTDIYKIVKMIMVKNYNPVIVFAFSKRETESLALSMAKLEFTTDDEREMIASVFNNATAGLSEEDRALPQIEHILPLLKRGIGIHHGGLLPLLKEVIEILFQEGLIKVLFATETFSIGLNMPAKTVIFTNVRKFDGKDFRNLTSGEYIQMSGRAGRRGLDDRGIVVMMVDEKLEPSAARNMVSGQADRLNSAFHLGYNMILNLMRVEGVSPDFMLERCFFQFQNASSVPKLEQELQELTAQHASMHVEQESEIAEYYSLRKQLEAFAQDARDCVNHPTYALPFLQPGRLLRVKADDIDFGWGVCVNFSKRTGPKGRPLRDELPQKSYIVDVLLNCATAKRDDVPALANGLRPCQADEEGEYVVVPVLLSTIDGISHLRIFLPKDLKPPEPRATVAKTVAEVKRRFPTGIDVLDPVENMGCKDEGFLKLLKRIEILEGKLAEHELHKSPRLAALYDAYAEKVVVQTKVADLSRRIAAAHSVMHLDELKHRKRLLRRLEFCTADDVVSHKGRVACEISTGDELLLTELIFGGVFNDLSPEQCAALCSCFVFQEKSEAKSTLKDELNGPLQKMREAATRIAKVAIECKIELDEQVYVASFKPELMDAVFKWCKGETFANVCKMTDVFEGSLIRAFRRLQELLRQLAMAAKAIGNDELETKFNKSLEALERPSSVVFSASLYL